MLRPLLALLLLSAAAGGCRCCPDHLEAQRVDMSGSTDAPSSAPGH